jgi:multiple sugar transport system ATP-binding protein
MGRVAIRALRKSFGRTAALTGIDLEIGDGEFVVLAGPKEAGKSTLLRVLAGLETADAGSIEIEGEAVERLTPRQRDVAMVFGNDAARPSKTVFENLAFGLRARKVPAVDVEFRVKRAAERLAIEPLLAARLDRLPPRMRALVAIGRALVRDAALCLFDDPLAVLDAPDRETARAELGRLHAAYPGTKLFATRDPVEAMTLADRVVILRAGRIEQQGAPLAIFEKPATLFVAGFFGSPPMNLLPGTLERVEAGDAVRLGADGPAVPLPPGRLPKDAASGLPVMLGIRPEQMARAVRVSPQDGTMRVQAEVEVLQPVGPRAYATFRIAGLAVTAELQAHDASLRGERIPIDINIRRASIFDVATGLAL